MQQPTVTVLIPCNSTDYLFDCLSSIEKQDYSELEILVVLNGSATNELKSLRQSFKDFSVPLEFVSTARKGIVHALNIGICLSKNEYIARMDSDDVMPARRITAQVAKFQSDTDLVCVGGQLEYLGNRSSRSHPGYPTKDDDIRHAMYRYSPFPHPGVMFLKSAVEQAGLYRQNYPYIEDWDLWIRLADVGKMTNLEETTVYHRLHENQSTQLYSQSQQASIQHLSMSILQKIICGPEQLVIQQEGIFAPQKLVGLMLQLILGGTTFKRSGIFGKRDLRRSLAGYIYVRGVTTNSTRIRFILSRIAVAMIDPTLVLAKVIGR